MDEVTRTAFNLYMSDEDSAQLPDGQTINREEAARVLKEAERDLLANIGKG